jgi:hypothetical protein
MIAIIGCVLIGTIVGWAISAWRHTRIDNAPPPPTVGISAIGLSSGKGGFYLEQRADSVDVLGRREPNR